MMRKGGAPSPASRVSLLPPLLLALSALSAPNLHAHEVAVAPAAAAQRAAYDLDADVNRVLKTFDVPGMAIAIVKDGKVVAAKGYGVRKLGEPAPVTGRTLFEIASNSKAFTAAALAMLVDEGKLKWDDPVIQHLPGFQMRDAYVTGAMTIRDLVTHRSGLGLGAGDLLWWPSSTYSTDEIIARLRFIRPATSFRNGYAYDNVHYIVAGRIVADKTGKSWEEAMRERILAPLGMQATTTSQAAMLRAADHAAPHSRVDERTVAVPAVPVENAKGAVGINSNAEDIARWMAMLLDGGRTPDGVQLISEKQLAEMWSPQTAMRIPDPKGALAATRPNFNAYGLGFQLRDYKGRKLALHGGALLGFYSRVLLVPEERLGVAIFTNAENGGSMNALQWRILDHYLGGSTRDWISIVADDERKRHREELAKVAKAAAARDAASRPSLALAAYEGDYQDPWYGQVTIRREGDRQVMRFARTPDLTGDLEHFQHDSFIVRWRQRHLNADAYVTFSLNPDGSIERVRMAPVSGETDFSFDFADLDLAPVKKP
ncbi:serine hydrolase [Pseudoduganella namucuonensis]|nr:serine hydrolase [Pseudoduganella namucuonensis]